MQVNIAGICRQAKNIAHNYSDAQKKVREATSNDHWGPTGTLMAEIADLTYNILTFPEIMNMIWKRMDDNGQNWRHVYKSLILLEYLIKTGSEKVGHQCKENIFFLQTLKGFQHLEKGKDLGQNVRRKAEQLVKLLKDDDRLKIVRTRALKTKERFSQTSVGFGNDDEIDVPSSPRFVALCENSDNDSLSGSYTSRDSVKLPREFEFARPQTTGEEELQLQLALVISKEEAQREEQKKRCDYIRLQLALGQSQQDSIVDRGKSQMVDLLEVNLDERTTEPWVVLQPPPRPQVNQRHNNVTPYPTGPQAGPCLSTLGSPVETNPWNPYNAVPRPTVSQFRNLWSLTSKTSCEECDAIINNNPHWPKTNRTSNNNTLDPFDLVNSDNLVTASQYPFIPKSEKCFDYFIYISILLYFFLNIFIPNCQVC